MPEGDKPVLGKFGHTENIPIVPPEGCGEGLPDTGHEHSHMNDEIMASLERHPIIVALRETKASEEVVRTAVHVIADRALDQAKERKARSDFLKQSAGKFGMSGHIKFVPPEEG